MLSLNLAIMNPTNNGPIRRISVAGDDPPSHAGAARRFREGKTDGLHWLRSVGAEPACWIASAGDEPGALTEIRAHADCDCRRRHRFDWRSKWKDEGTPTLDL